MWVRPCGPMKTVTYLLFSIALTRKEHVAICLAVYPFKVSLGKEGASPAQPLPLISSKQKGSCCYSDFSFVVLRIFAKTRDRSSRVSTSQILYLITDLSICIELSWCCSSCVVLSSFSEAKTAADPMLGTGWGSEGMRRVKKLLKKWGNLQLCLQRQVLEAPNSWL